MFLGEESILSGEAHSRADINLPGDQAELVRRIRETGKPVVAVILAGRPLTLTNIVDQVDAILFAWHPGTMGGPAIADLLFGIESPSGKLPATFPRMVGQIPIYYSQKNSGKPASWENISHIDEIDTRAPQTSLGMSAFHLDTLFTPLFAFGHGLSYAAFDYQNIRSSTHEVKLGETVTVSADLTNHSDVAADEVVQFYMRDVVASVTRPVKELKGFGAYTLRRARPLVSTLNCILTISRSLAVICEGRSSPASFMCGSAAVRKRNCVQSSGWSRVEQMNSVKSIISMISVVMLSTPVTSLAQVGDEQQQYVVIDCLKSTSANRVNLESDAWLASQQSMVDRGELNSWALYSVLYGDRSRCDFYVATTYVGDEQLNNNQSKNGKFKSVQRVATELWAVIDRTEIEKHRYAVVNFMHAPDADAYQRMESRVFKPGHQALLDSDHRAGWAMYELVSPVGTSIPYNFSTVDFSNFLSPVPMAEAMIAANPDRDIEEMHELLQLREHVSSQTLLLIAATEKSENR